MMTRPWNFSAGPSALPVPVLQQAAAEMLDWGGSGMAVMEMSHRGKAFTHICDEAEADLRALLDIPDDYAVMFMQGGATAENAIVPLNLPLPPTQPLVPHVASAPCGSGRGGGRGHRFANPNRSP